jgi:hypothetical protein
MSILIVFFVVAIAVVIMRIIPGGCNRDCNQGRNCSCGSK